MRVLLDQLLMFEGLHAEVMGLHAVTVAVPCLLAAGLILFESLAFGLVAGQHLGALRLPGGTQVVENGAQRAGPGWPRSATSAGIRQ